MTKISPRQEYVLAMIDGGGSEELLPAGTTRSLLKRGLVEVCEVQGTDAQAIIARAMGCVEIKITDAGRVALRGKVELHS